MGSLTIKPEVLVPSPHTVVLENVKSTGHLTEDKHTRTLLTKTRKEFVQKHHFTTIVNKVLIGGVGWARFHAIKEVWVVATLSQLHKHVEKADLVSFLASRVDQIEVLHENLRVELTLHLAQANINLNLLLWRKTFFHISFNTTQKEWPENLGKVIGLF